MDLFTSDHLQSYFEKELGWGWGYQARIVFDFLISAAHCAQGGVVLDAGAGHQRYKPFFHEALYLAQEHPVSGLEGKGLTKYDILADCKEIPLIDNTVNVVLSTSSLEHMEFPEDFFREAYRVLVPGGRLFINAPFAYEEHEIPYDFQRPTRFGIKHWYGINGFVDISVFPSSSSMEAARHLLQVAIEDDCTSDMADVAGQVLNMMDILCVRLDKGPTEKTRLPIGWTATGAKPGGIYERHKPLNLAKEFFLLQNLNSHGGRYRYNGTSIVAI